MNTNKFSFPLVVLFLFTLPYCAAKAQSDDKTKEKKPQSTAAETKNHLFTVADGMFQFEAPGKWKKIKPKFEFYHAEFQIPKTEKDETDGRITFSQVGGTIDQNLERWVGQFKLDKNDENSIDKKTVSVDGKKVQLIRLSGTFMESAGGPVGPKTDREGYVLFGAAIETGEGGNVYIKAYGPAKTMKENEKDLKALVEGMKVVDG